MMSLVTFGLDTLLKQAPNPKVNGQAQPSFGRFVVAFSSPFPWTTPPLLTLDTPLHFKHNDYHLQSPAFSFTSACHCGQLLNSQ